MEIILPLGVIFMAKVEFTNIWEMKVEAWKLMAKSVPMSQIASQFSRTDRTLRSWKKELLGLSPNLVQTLPPEVQEFWEMKTGKKLKSLQASSARAQRLDRHWANLTIVAEGLLANFKKIIKIRPYGNFEVVGNVVDGGSIELDGSPAPVHFSKSTRDDSQRLEKIDGYLTQRLLEHLEKKCHVLSNINDWKELSWGNISDELLEKLSFVAHGGIYKGTTCKWCLQNDLESE